MKRVGPVLLAMSVIVVLGAAGCSKKAATTTAPPVPTSAGTASPTGSGSASPSPSGVPASQYEFSVDGAGPYKLGLTLTALQASPGLAQVSTTGPCPGNTTARGTGNWSDVELWFHSDGKLYLAINRSINVPTPSGVYLGTTLDNVKKIYVGVGGESLTHGTDSAFLVVTLSGAGILFGLDTTQRVISMTVGDSGLLRTNYRAGLPFC